MRKLTKKIVCFGGGNAMPKAVLSGLKEYPVQITSVTSMVDSGGSTGQLRRDFNVLPPGDIRRHLITLADAPSWKKDLFSFRFGHEEFDGGHKGHSFANVFLAGLEHVLKDFEKALQFTHEFLEIKKHQALPAIVKTTHVFAELENGQIIKGEDEIDVPKIHDGNLKIKRVYLEPQVESYPPVLQAIKAADLIIIGPGDLYSSLIPCFLSKGMNEAMRITGAKKVLICPPMTKLGETNNFSVLDFAGEMEKYIDSPLDFVFYNAGIPDQKRVEDYKKEEPLMLDPIKINKTLDRKKFIGKNLLVKSGPIIYDPQKAAKILMKI